MPGASKNFQVEKDPRTYLQKYTGVSECHSQNRAAALWAGANNNNDKNDDNNGPFPQFRSPNISST